MKREVRVPEGQGGRKRTETEGRYRLLWSLRMLKKTCGKESERVAKRMQRFGLVVRGTK